MVLLSLSHYNHEIRDMDKKKPQMIMDYNKTKGGTDLMDQMLAKYSTLAAFIIYNANNGGKVTRRKFLKKLAQELCLEQILIRKTNPDFYHQGSNGSDPGRTHQQSVS